MDLDLMINSLPKLLSATLTTLKLLSLSLIFGLIIGLTFAIMRLSNNKLISNFSYSFSYVFRGTPLLVQDFITPSASEAQIINQVKEALTYKMKACLWIPEESNQYEQQKKWINAKNTLLEFSDLKEKLALGEDLLNAKKISGRNLLGHILSLPNLIPLWITRVVINRSEDRVFVSSIKYASGAFLFPIWWLCSTLAIAPFFGLSIALLYFLVSLASLFLRQRILLI